jgi:hypothetical protein
MGPTYTPKPSLNPGVSQTFEIQIPWDMPHHLMIRHALLAAIHTSVATYSNTIDEVPTRPLYEKEPLGHQ